MSQYVVLLLKVQVMIVVMPWCVASWLQSIVPCPSARWIVASPIDIWWFKVTQDTSFRCRKQPGRKRRDLYNLCREMRRDLLFFGGKHTIIYVIIYIYIFIEQTRESWEGLGCKAIGVRYDMFVTFATKMSNNWNWDKIYMWRHEQYEVIYAQNWMWRHAPLWTRRSEGSRQKKDQTFQRGVSKRITPLEIALCHWTTAVNWHFAANMAGMEVKICAYSI